MSQSFQAICDSGKIICSQIGAPLKLRFTLQAAVELVKRLEMLAKMDREIPHEEVTSMKMEGSWGYISILNTEGFRGKILIGNDGTSFIFGRLEYLEIIDPIKMACAQEVDLELAPDPS